MASLRSCRLFQTAAAFRWAAPLKPHACLHAPAHLARHFTSLPSCLLRVALQLMQADTFDLHSFHTLTGTTFMLLTEPHTPDAAELLRTT